MHRKPSILPSTKKTESAHPNIYKLIKLLQDEQATSEAVLRLRRAGQPAPKKRAKYLDSARRLERLHNELASGQRGLLQFLDACSTALKL